MNRAPADQPPGQRIEPSIDDHAFPQGPSSAYEHLHGLGPEFGESGYQPKARSRLARIARMAAVFVVGAGVGLGAAWWLHTPQQVAPVAVVPSSSVRSVPATPSTDGKRSAAIRGISPSELPYDGRPPPAPEQSSPEPVASRTPALPEASSGGSVASTSGERNAGPGDAQPDTSTAMPATPTVQMQTSSQEARAEDEPKPARASKAVRQSDASVASAAPKRKNTTKTDREIERIRRQVDEELKKKTEQGRGLSDPRSGAGQGARKDQGSRRDTAASTGISRISAIRASLAQCDRKSNFIRRELCRWQVCNGSWGRNGCPSYQQQASSH